MNCHQYHSTSKRHTKTIEMNVSKNQSLESAHF